MSEHYTPQEEALLLRIAREALQQATTGAPPTLASLEALPPALRAVRACFVTLHTVEGELRGCTGTLVARQPLAHEVVQMAVQTALHDPRFYPVQAHELPHLVIELSVLTPPLPLHFTDPAEIPRLLRPHVDGVLLTIGARRATFLPQVWERVPDTYEFLDLLCRKMGLPPGAWQTPKAQVQVYQTAIIEEKTAPN